VSHDLLAELAGYRAELDREERHRRTDRAAAVREEIARVRDQIADQADELDAKAEEHVANGQDTLAAQAAVEARRLREGMDVEPQPDPGGPAETPVPLFLPYEHNVDQVLEYLERQDDEDEVRRVLDAEDDAPKPRTGITGKRDEILARFAPPQQ
jgi:predicted RecB family nuclease